ncbi:MAG: response regulator transcription factor [Verrucomicrobiota bacterium]|nr:response regulator transcription factor [Limisphaera sp.]MDW8381810.1 response regulator transcription factor [Verrucomicrobiota bacterium]
MTQRHQPRPEGRKARILLVDDHAVVRFGIAQLINRQPDLEVCGEEADASTAFSAAERLKPDLVIADLSLKESSGLELVRNLKARFPSMPILVLSVHDESVYAEMAFRAGAMGYLMKDQALEKVLEAIRRLLNGSVYVSDAMAVKLLQKQLQGTPAVTGSPADILSDRELEVFELVGRWKTTRQIAQELHISIKTVEYYREQIKRKLGLKNAVELVQHATAWVERASSSPSSSSDKTA